MSRKGFSHTFPGLFTRHERRFVWHAFGTCRLGEWLVTHAPKDIDPRDFRWRGRKFRIVDVKDLAHQVSESKENESRDNGKGSRNQLSLQRKGVSPNLIGRLFTDPSLMYVKEPITVIHELMWVLCNSMISIETQLVVHFSTNFENQIDRTGLLVWCCDSFFLPFLSQIERRQKFSPTQTNLEI